jgi:hypothetical protein
MVVFYQPVFSRYFIIYSALLLTAKYASLFLFNPGTTLYLNKYPQLNQRLCLSETEIMKMSCDSFLEPCCVLCFLM